MIGEWQCSTQLTIEIMFVGLLGTITKTAETTACPGKCIHALASLLCDEVREEITCPQEGLRCCVDRRRPSRPPPIQEKPVQQETSEEQTTEDATTTTRKKMKKKKPPTTERTIPASMKSVRILNKKKKAFLTFKYLLFHGKFRMRMILRKRQTNLVMGISIMTSQVTIRTKETSA